MASEAVRLPHRGALDDSGSLDTTASGTRFLRDRLILICKVFAFINLTYCGLFALALRLDSSLSYFELFMQLVSLETLGEYALFALVAMGCHRFGTNATVLRLLDAALLIGLGCLWSSWCFIHPYPALGAYEMVLALVAVPVLRAVLIPSTGVRTFALTATACVPGLIASFVAPTLRGSTLMTPATLTVLVLNWCSLSVVFSTVASSVVYGLRSAVNEARRLGQYTLVAKLGEGGMGKVFLARHALLRRLTAVKLISAEASPQALDRFEREVQLTSQLTHPNIISIYDFGRTEEGAFYYAMEHLEGMDLQEIVSATGPCPASRVIHILRQACGALEEAHGSGLLHRDIKPSNIFLCPKRGARDVIKLLDFGLVKDLRHPSSASLRTQATTLVGTPHYMSPELISKRDEADPRSDIYALGAVGYYLLTGRPPFTGRNVVEVCAQHLYATPALPDRGERPVPADLEAVVLRCLEKRPEARFPDARALRDALDACADAHSWHESDALRWWAERSDALTAARAKRTPSSPPTLAVDLKQRAAFAPTLPHVAKASVAARSGSRSAA